MRAYLGRLRSSEDYRNSQGVAVVVRWFVLASWLVLLNYRPDDVVDKLLTLNLLAIPLIAMNGYVSWRLRTGRTVSAIDVYALSLLDIALVTTALGLVGGFANTFFVFYYPVLVGISLAFQRRRVVFGLGAIAVGGYVFVSLFTGAGVDIEAGQDQVLAARVVTMIGVMFASNLITRIERAGRRAAVAGERAQAAENLELQRQAMTAEIAVTKERGRIAREIHDGIAQEVYMLGLGLETALELADRDPDAVKQRLSSLLPVAKQTLLHTRNYLYDLKPLLDGEQGLVELAQNQVQEFTAVTGLPVELTVQGEPRTIEVQRATALYRMIQESLANVLKHAQASEVRLVIAFEPKAVRIAIEDDGVGFDPASHHIGYGLANIRERAEELGGDCEMATNAGHGTVITARVPA